MKNTNKNSTKKHSNQNDDTLIYILLFLLLALLVGGTVYYFYDKNKRQEIVYDYSELGKKKSSPTAKNVLKLLLGNRKRVRTIRNMLNSENRKVSTSEKNKVEQELEKHGINQLNKFLYDTDLKKLTPEQLADAYSQLYEQGKILVRLRCNIGNDKSYQEQIKQKETIQPQWNISSTEKQEIAENLDRWLKAWYNQFMEQELKPELGEAKLTQYVEPRWINGKKVGANYTSAQVNYFRKIIGDYHFASPTISFNGWKGFVDSTKKSDEDKETHGLTESDCAGSIPSKKIFPEKPKDRKLTPEEKALRRRAKMTPNYNEVWVMPNNHRSITISLKKELFFNRLGYDEWITKLSENNRTYTNICFDGTVETIAHELAHAVVNSLYGKYRGERKGGHGKIHDNITDRVETMMRKTPEFTEFKNWWNKKRN